jgi:hypothetical protein
MSVMENLPPNIPNYKRDQIEEMLTKQYHGGSNADF